MLTLMQFLKFRIVIFSCKWGAQLNIQIMLSKCSRILGSCPLPSGKRRGKCVQEQILHITYPSSYMHIFIAFASFLCHLKGQPPKPTPKYFVSAFSAACVSLLWHDLCKTFFRKQQTDCCWAHLLACTVKVLSARSRGGGKPTAVWRPGRRRGGCAFCGSPRLLKSGTLWLVRK